MLLTSSQNYGSYYKNDPRFSSPNERKVQSEPRDFRSLTPARPGSLGVTNVLAEAAANTALVYKAELHSSPFIKGQKNPHFLNQSMLASDTLAAPNYDGAQSTEKRDLTRYQPYLSPSKKADKGMAPKIGHGDYPEVSPTRLSPDGKLPWQRAEIPKHAVKKLEFEPDAGAITKTPQQFTPVKTQPEKVSPQPVEVHRPVVEPENNKPEVVPQQNDDTPYFLKRALSAPGRDIPLNVKRPSDNIKENTPIQKEATPIHKEANLPPAQSNITESHEAPSIQEKKKEPTTIKPKAIEPRPIETKEFKNIQKTLSLSPVKPGTAIFRTSASEIGKFFSKALITQHRSDVTTDNNRPQSSLEFRNLSPQNVQSQEKPEAVKVDHIAEENSADRSQPKTPASVHSCHSHGSNDSGKNLLCEICVNKRLKNYKDLEKAQLREQDLEKDREHLRKLEALRELQQEKMQKAKQEALAGTNAMKEALDQKFHDYWEHKRNAGRLASEEQKLREQELELQRQAALNIHQKQKDELKAELLKQIQDKNEERDREKRLDQAPGQNTSLTATGIHWGGQPYTPDQLKQDLLQQMEEKQEQRRREFEQEKELAEGEKDRREKLNRDLRETAEKYHSEKKEALRRNIEEGIAELQAKKEKALAEKMEDRDRIMRHQDAMRQSAIASRQSQQDFQKNYAGELQKQMQDNQLSKEQERRWEREAYETSLGGLNSRMKDPSYFENILKQHQEERAKLREEYQQQIAEKKRQREQEKLDDLKYVKTGLETTNLRYNPLIEMRKSLQADLAEQIKQKQEEKAEATERDRQEARELRGRLQSTEDELRRRAYENHHKQRDEYRKGLEEGLHYKQLEREALLNEKAYERADIEEKNKLARSMLLQNLLNKNAHAKEYSEALAAQISGSNAIKAHERELDRKAYAASITSPSRIIQKLYSCMDCSREYPKTLLTKKSAIEPPKRVGWQKY